MPAWTELTQNRRGPTSSPTRCCPSPQGVLAVIAARSPAEAARHFEYLTGRALTLTREPTEPSPHWYFLCWDGPPGSSAPRPIQSRWLRPLAAGEEFGQQLAVGGAVQGP